MTFGLEACDYFVGVLIAGGAYANVYGLVWWDSWRDADALLIAPMRA